MRVFGAAIMAGVLFTGAAHAQVIVRPVPPGIVIASDLDGPYDDGAPDLPPRYAPSPYGPRAYGPPPPDYGPPPYGQTAYMLPIHEIYRIVREGGYSPLGAPQQRGGVYTISVLDVDGEDGRLVIDARNGRIIRFVPADRYSTRSDRRMNLAYGPLADPLPRPPAGIAQAHASVPLPKPRVAAVRPLPERSATFSAARPATIPPAPTAALAAAPPAPPPVAAKPAVTLQPTQAMPPAQGVE